MKHAALAAVVSAALWTTAAAQSSTQSDSSGAGRVRIGQQVMLDGKPLPAGTYQIRVASGVGTSGREAEPGAVGTSGRPASAADQNATWIEFVQNGEVKGRVMAIVPPPGKRIPPGIVAQRVRNDDDPYIRVSINRPGEDYLVYLPTR
jgi:hypothetical protein